MKKQDKAKPKKEYRTYQFHISKGDALFEYCDTMCFNSKNMYNVTNFYIRQIMTGVKKDKPLLTDYSPRLKAGGSIT